MMIQLYIEKVGKGLYKIVKFITSILIALIFTLLFVQVIFRYIIHVQLFWIEESVCFSMIYVTLLGSALAFESNRHPRISIVYSKIKNQYKLVYELFLRFFLFIFILVFINIGWPYAVANSFMTSSGLGINYFWIYLAYPIGGICMLLLLLLDTIDLVFYKKSYLKTLDLEEEAKK
jgi:TRAP-type C4-dicarboxylate transport system permease small subunit